MVLARTLEQLSKDERNALENLLMEFDSSWHAEKLANFVADIQQRLNENSHALAVAELVKIDLHRQWDSGKSILIDQYFSSYPELCQGSHLMVELLLAEFQSRRGQDPQLALESYEARFPEHYENLKALADSSVDSTFESQTKAGKESTSQAKASIETSRVAKPDSTETRRDISSLPNEFGRYHIIRELGSGAMGNVYLAHDTQLDRQVALKTPSFDGEKDEELIARFYQEARAAAKIHHRNICPIYDVGEIDGQHFISMAFIKGHTMAKYINKDKLPVQKACAVLIHRLANALAEAHRHNVIHRDLKPANIMIDTKREPVVMDFGLARQTDAESRMTQSGLIVGTPAYMSPEQVTGEQSEITPAVDIYSLGVILYEMLTGKLPFRGTITQVIYKITHEDPIPPSQVRDGLDPRLESVCLQMMAKNRSDRYESMDDVAADLKAYLQQGGRGSVKTDSHKETVTPKNQTTKNIRDSQKLTETEAINAFLMAQSDSEEQQTLIEAAPQLKVQSEVLTTNRASKSKSFGENKKTLTVAILGGMLLLMGVIIYFKGGKVELDDDSNAIVEVGADGSLNITPDADTAKRPGKSQVSVQGEWTPLFNGQDLSGWDGDPRFWSVQDGCITGESTASNISKQNTGLIWRNGNVSDFHLKLQFRIYSGNSGIQYRSREVAEMKWVLSGYQADIDSQHELTGGLYGEKSRGKIAMPGQSVKIDDGGKPHIEKTFTSREELKEQLNDAWNVYEVIARGNHLIHKVNGVVTMECLDEDILADGRRAESGLLALQLHRGDPMKVQFRDIQLNDLGANDLASYEDSRRIGVDTPLRTGSYNSNNFFTIQNEGGGGQFAVSPDGLTMVTTGGGSPGRFTFWDLRTRKMTFQFTDPKHPGMGTRDLHFSPDGTHFLYVVNKFVKVLNLKTLTIEQEHEFPVTPGMAVFPDRSWAAAIHYERAIHQRDRARVPQRLRIWDWQNGQTLYDQALDYSRNVSITPDGKYLFRSRENYHVRHAINWDGTTLTLGREVQFEKTSRTRSSLQYSPDGRFAANSLKSNSGMAVLMDVATGRIVRYLEPEIARANNAAHEYGASVTFTHDGKQIVTANHLGQVTLRDRDTGEFIREITSFTKTSNHWTPRLHVSSRGQLFIGLDPIQVWDLKVDLDQRAAGIRILESGGIFSVLKDDQTIGVREIDEIPDEPFEFLGASWRYKIKVNDFGDELGPLSRSTKLENLMLNRPGISDAGFEHISKMKSLEKLWLARTNIKDEHLRHIGELENLRRLYLFTTGVTDSGLAHLSSLKSLRDLHISNTQITDSGIVHLLSLENLSKLDLTGTQITNSGLEQLSSMKKLKTLYVSNTQVTAEYVEHLRKQLPGCAIQYRIKDVPEPDFDEEEDQRAIAEHFVNKLEAYVGPVGPNRDWVSGELPPGDVRVEWVSFKGKGGRIVTDEDIALLSGLPHLDSVWFGQTTLTDAGFAHLCDIQTLRRIEFIKEALTDEGLARLASLPRLETLYVYHTKVTDDGLKTLADFPALRYLTLGISQKKKFGNAYFTNAGLAHLSAIKKLERLTLWGPTYTDACVDDLAELQQLKQLTLWTPNITESAVAELQRHLPGCSISQRSGTSEPDEDEGDDRDIAMRLLEFERTTVGIGPLEEHTLYGRIGEKTLPEGDLSVSFVRLGGVPESPDLIDLLLELRHLKSISVDRSNYFESALTRIAEIEQLEELEISRTEHIADGLEAFRKLKNLRSLTLFGARLDLNELRQLAAITQLEQLKITRNTIADGELAWLTKMENLRTLELNLSDFNDEGLKSIAGLPALTELTLRIPAEKPIGLSDAGLAHLKSLTTLSALSLYDEGFTDEALTHLAECKSLKALNLFGSNFSSERVTWLREQLPDCFIGWEQSVKPHESQPEN